MSTEYVGRDEIEAHKAAMQRVVEDDIKELKAIVEYDKKYIYADRCMKNGVEEADERLRRAIEVAKKAASDEIMATKQRAEEMKSKANQKMEDMTAQAKRSKVETLVAMQRDFEHLYLLRQVYHEAPHDVFELIVSKCSELDVIKRSWVLPSRGGLNAFRLANKRLKQVVESCTTKISNYQDVYRIIRMYGPDSLPMPMLQRCRRIEHIRCEGRNLRSLEGCPNGLKRLWIGDAPHIIDLSPLASCSMMESLWISNSSISDISVVASMPHLDEFGCQKRGQGRPSIKDLSPLSSCTRLKQLSLNGNTGLKDLFPLSACLGLEKLDLTNCSLLTCTVMAPLSTLQNLQDLGCSNCPLISSLEPLSRNLNLEFLRFGNCPLISSLDSLSSLKKLKSIHCPGINPQTSLLPLAACNGLESVWCLYNAVDLDELRSRRPDIQMLNN